MTIGSWDPTVSEVSANSDIPVSWLLQCITWSQADRLTELDTLISSAEQQTFAPLMQREQQDWQQAVADMDSEQLLHLLRFFTAAEQLPGWDAGHKSPVIVFAKLLRNRGDKLSRETLLWIREHSDNRFLPYGPL